MWKTGTLKDASAGAVSRDTGGSLAVSAWGKEDRDREWVLLLRGKKGSSSSWKRPLPQAGPCLSKAGRFYSDSQMVNVFTS